MSVMTYIYNVKLLLNSGLREYLYYCKMINDLDKS